MRAGSNTRRFRLLEELGELFAPAFGPAVEARGESFAERLLEDQELRAGILTRFERGRAQGRFPALSEHLHGRSGKEIEEFFRSGWTRLAVPPPRSSEKPWIHAPWNGNLEAYREDLYAGMAFGLSDLRDFAQEWLEELVRVGYYGMEESLGLPLKQQADDLSSVPRPLPLYGEAYPVRFEDTDRVFWLQLDARRSERGYRSISVTDEPLLTDKAILAALTALEARAIDVGRLKEALPEIVPSYGESVWERWDRVRETRRPSETTYATGHREATEDLRQRRQTLEYVLTLLRYHRPNFDNLPIEERADLVAGTCEHVNSFLEALRKLMAFIEHGKPGRRGRVASIRVAERDIRAAVLRDVDGLTYREIGGELGVPLPVEFDIKGDHASVRRMVGRGRAFFENALGEEGWRRQIETMKTEAARWFSLDETEQEAEMESEALNIPYKEALRRVKEERIRQRGDSPGIM